MRERKSDRQRARADRDDVDDERKSRLPTPTTKGNGETRLLRAPQRARLHEIGKIDASHDQDQQRAIEEEHDDGFRLADEDDVERRRRIHGKAPASAT
jgi:hypothetical protein